MDAPGPNGSTAKKVLGLLALGIIFLFLGSMLVATEAHFVPQIPDLYLTCQYARSIAEGHPFQYNPGEPASTGSTSLLHTLILAGAHAVGIQGEGLIAFAILGGAALYMGSVLLAHRIGLQLGGEREGFLAGLLVALGGPVVWGFLYGADVALFMFLALWLLDRMLCEWSSPRPRGVALVGILLALARPEGLPIALLLGAGWYLGHARDQRGGGWIWTPAATGLLVVAFYRLLTGRWLGTSLADRSLLANYGLLDSTAIVAEYLMDVSRGFFSGFYPSQVQIGLNRGWLPFFCPPLSAIGITMALLQGPELLRRPLRLWISIAVVVCVLVSPNMFLGTHFNRHLMWTFPGLLVVIAVGFSLAVRRFAAGDIRFERSLFGLVVAGCAIFGLLSTLRLASVYGDRASTLWLRDARVARWISKNLPPGVRIAHVATTVEYLTGHYGMNLQGVMTPAFLGNNAAEREAGTLESLGRLPVAERPPYLMTMMSAQEAYPSLREMTDGPPLFETESFENEILIFKMRWDLVGSNREILLQRTRDVIGSKKEVDRLNLCDSADEASHSYQVQSRLGNMTLHGTARIADYDLAGTPHRVADGGRAVVGSESFNIKTTPGRELLLVLRTADSVGATILRASGTNKVAIDLAEQSLQVAVDGQTSGRLTFKPQPGWDEIVVRVTANLITSEQTQLTISGKYASFYYWFFQ